MTIASAITNAQNKVAAAYTSVNTMGGTLPATQNLSNLPTAIESIPSGGGGDTVYAINDTGSTISQGDKVWLNKHNNPSVTGSNYVRYSQGVKSAFIMEGNVPYEFTNGNLLQWTFSNDSWSSTTIQSSISGEVGHPMFVGTQPIFRAMNPSNGVYQKDIIINTQGTSFTLANNSFYIGNDRIVKCTSNKNYSIVEYDHTTGTEGNTLGTFMSVNNIFHNAFIDGTLLMIASGTGSSAGCTMEYYDISDMTAIVKTHTVVCPEYSTYLYYVTGLDVGDYLFFQSAASSDNWGGTAAPVLKIYKLGADFAITPARDLPLQLQQLNNSNAVVNYDSRTKYLTVGTNSNVYFFKFDTTTKTFEQFLLDVTMPTEHSIYSGYAYVPVISGDKTNVVITFRAQSSSYVYVGRKIYKLSNADNTEWYVEPYGNFNVSTLTGYATGNTSDGKYEIATVLPETVQVEVNGGDEVEYFGGAE